MNHMNDTCIRCNSQIEGEHVKITGASFHPACFKCQVKSELHFNLRSRDVNCIFEILFKDVFSKVAQDDPLDNLFQSRLMISRLRKFEAVPLIYSSLMSIS